MKSLFSFAAAAIAGILLAAPLPAQELLLNYKFDESDSGNAPTADLGEAEPKVPGRFFVNATRTSNTPGGASLGALDVTNGQAHVLANHSNLNVDSLDGKLDDLNQATITVWINLQATPEEHDRVFSMGLKGLGLQILPPVSIDGAEAGTFSASNFSLGLDTTDGTGPSYRNFDADNKWLFVAISFDGQEYDAETMRFYTGDEATESSLITANTPNVWKATSTLASPLYVGNHSTKGTRQFNGYVDDLRIYSGVLTPEQIEEVRLENLVVEEPPPANPLLVHYNFDEAASGDADTADLSQIAPYVDGRFKQGATRTSNTPGSVSLGALDVTAPTAWLIANQNDLEGKLDNLSTFTTTVWVNLQGDPILNDRIFRAGDPAAGFGYRIIDPSSGTISASNFGLVLEAANRTFSSGINIDASNKWVFLAYTFSGQHEEKTVQFILGDESASAQLETTLDAGTLSNTGALASILALGGHAAVTGRQINGYLDDFRVYGGVLSLSEIEAIRRENLGLLPPSGGYDGWVAVNFDAGEQADPAISGTEADPDGDGIANLLEYALAGNPNVASRDILPTVNLDTVSGYLTLTFVRPDDTDDVDYIVESSTTLAGWSTDAVLIDSTPVSGGTQETYRAPSPMTEQERSFLRLRISN